MNWHSAISSTISERVQNLQSQLFPISAVSPQGFLNGFLLNNIKTTQIEVNNEQAVSRRLARLKEPRDLFAVPMEQGDQQDGARWPIECQVLTDRVHHIPYTPPEPEPYYKPTGKELQPQPNGEENGTVIYNYIPLSAVNYDEDFDDTNDLYSEDSELANRFTPPLELITRYDYKESPLINPRLFGYRKPIIPPSEPVAQEPQLNQFTSINKDDDLDKMELTVATELGTNGLPVPSLEDIENVADTEPKLIFPQFSRSNVGGCKFLTSVHVSPHEENDLIFESRFESGNLAKVVKITSTYYELYLRPDMYTNRNKQWFYFRVSNTKMNQIYRFSIVNLTKSDSLYNEGMRPLMYSTHDADKNKIGWRRCGENIAYYKNDSESNGGSTSKSQTDVKEKESESEDDTGSTLTFTIEFPYENDVVYFAHSYPYTYSQLQDYLMNIQKHPTKSKFCKLRLLCRSLAGNNIYVLTITSPPINEEVPPDKINKKKAIVVSARVHPGETPASWMMKGFLDFITSDSLVAKKLRHKFVFKVIPMLNPDGVIVGNTRSSLTGKDLNRQYRTVIRETYPSIWYTKMLIRRLIEENGVLMYCDMHAHSRQHNIFIYGCENRKCPDRKLLEQVFPLMLHKNAADKFSFEHCKFKVQRNKEGTGRIVVWMLGVMNSYTMEASFGGTNIGSRAKTHFSATDYENIGRSFCETLLDYADESPNKVIEMRRQIKNMRRRERKLRRARMKRIAAEEKLKQKIMNRLVEAGSKADGPQNIPLSDYSSDNEDSFGSDSDDEELLKTSELEGTCCKQPKVPPPSPEVKPKISVKKVSKRESNENNIVGKRKYRKRRSSVRAASEKSSKINIIQNLLQDQPVDYSNSQEITDQSLMVKKPKPKLQFASIKSKRIFRSVIDLSTTEPNFQPQLRPDGTYEECGNISDGYDTVPSVYRSSIRNEIYKNNIMPRVASGSPPELMIKRVAGHNDDGDVILSSCREQELSTVIYNVSEFPSIHGNKKTTKSIRKKTINVSMSSKENSLIRKDSVEMNKINLVMRNHIWSGSCTGTTEYTRPLSWGVPRLSAKPTIDEQEELLNACSKKLYIWKETKKRSQSKKRSKIEGKSAPSSIKQLPKVRKSSIDRHRDISLLNSNRPQTSADPDNCNLLGHMISHPTEEPQKLSIINLSPAKIKKTKTANRKITSFKAAEIVATAIQPSKKIKNARAKQKTKGNSDQSPQLKKLVQRVKTKLRK